MEILWLLVTTVPFLLIGAWLGRRQQIARSVLVGAIVLPPSLLWGSYYLGCREGVWCDHAGEALGYSTAIAISLGITCAAMGWAFVPRRDRR